MNSWKEMSAYFAACDFLLSSHKKKRAKQVKKLMQRGLLDPEKVDPFSLFIESGGVSFCLYRDSHRILGHTYGLCILQVCYLVICLSRDSRIYFDNLLCIIYQIFQILHFWNQDFEALTPNILARSIETVEGGGLVILLLRSLSSLSSLYTMVMVCTLLLSLSI